MGGQCIVGRNTEKVEHERSAAWLRFVFAADLRSLSVDILDPPAIPIEEDKPEAPIMTEDEERELADLLSNDDQ